MEICKEKTKEYMKRLILSRTRLLCNHGFYGVLLMHMKFGLEETISTAGTDGVTTYFSPVFLETLSDRELDFVLMHEVLHVVLQHCSRYENRHRLIFNLACDIVVNSNILYSNGMDLSSITLEQHGESMHLAPNGKEGYLYTAEEVYEMLIKEHSLETYAKAWDIHDFWGTFTRDSVEVDAWKHYFKDACQSIGMRGGKGVPLFAERMLKDMQKPQIDWRTLINDFVQQDVCDYSFVPPDKRFYEVGFLMPDYNDFDSSIKNILFMIDTSASMSNEMVSSAYYEVKGAIDQYGEKLQGWLGFFDWQVKEIKPFSDVEELLKIRPIGGGGTNFKNVFIHINNKMQDNPPTAIIILSDGYADFPDEIMTNGIPVLWVINNDKVEPPWGKVARIK